MVNGYRNACLRQQSVRYCHLTKTISLPLSEEIVEKEEVFQKMFSKFKIEKPPNVHHKRGPRHFEVEQSLISLPLLEVYDQHIRHLHTENEQLQAEKMEDAKVINGQVAQLAERRTEVFHLDQELQLLRDKVAQSRLAVNPRNLTSAARAIGTWTGLRGV